MRHSAATIKGSLSTPFPSPPLFLFSIIIIVVTFSGEMNARSDAIWTRLRTAFNHEPHLLDSPFSSTECVLPQDDTIIFDHVIFETPFLSPDATASFALDSIVVGSFNAMFAAPGMYQAPRQTNKKKKETSVCLHSALPSLTHTSTHDPKGLSS